MQDAVIKQAAERFGKEAREYIALIGSKIEGHQLLTELRIRLPSLLAGVAQLPAVAPSADAEVEGMAQDEKAELQRALDSKLPFKSYWEICEVARQPLEPPVPGLAQLSDDLADIYADLRRGFAQPTDIDRVWSWRFSWETHWGRHAANALRAITGII